MPQSLAGTREQFKKIPLLEASASVQATKSTEANVGAMCTATRSVDLARALSRRFPRYRPALTGSAGGANGTTEPAKTEESSWPGGRNVLLPMNPTCTYADQVEIDVVLVHRLVSTQFPNAAVPVTRLANAPERGSRSSSTWSRSSSSADTPILKAVGNISARCS